MHLSDNIGQDSRFQNLFQIRLANPVIQPSQLLIKRMRKLNNKSWNNKKDHHR